MCDTRSELPAYAERMVPVILTILIYSLSSSFYWWCCPLRIGDSQDRRMVTCSLWPVLSTQCGTKGLSFVPANGVTADMWIQSIVRLTRTCHRLHTLLLQRWCHQWLEAAWVTWPSRVLLSVFLDLSRWVFSPRSLVRAHICGCLLLHGWQCFPKC